MDRQQILTEYDKMRQSIKSAEDQYLETMYQYVKKYFQTIPKEQWSWENFSPSLEDLVYNSLIETYSITIKAVKTIYNIDFTEIIDEDSIKDLTYSKDGKTLSERLRSHYDKAIKRTNPVDYFYNRLVLVMDTETLYASNHVIHGKLKNMLLMQKLLVRLNALMKMKVYVNIMQQKVKCRLKSWMNYLHIIQIVNVK